MQPTNNCHPIPIPEVVDRNEDELWEEWHLVNDQWENKFTPTSPQPLVDDFFQDTERLPLIDFSDQDTE